jgi:hypothetical protein
VWQAIRNLSATGRPTVDRLRFIGELPPRVRAELDTYGLMPCVETTGFLPNRTAIDQLRTADALLLAGPSDASAGMRGWIPAKLFEYLATDLPIIYVGDHDSDAAKLLAQHPGGYRFGTGDVEGITDALMRCRGNRQVRDVSAFGWDALTETLADLLDDAYATSRGVLTSTQSAP